MANNNDNKVLNVPNLRFPEFTGEWKQTKFKDVCKVETGNKNTQDKVEDGLYPFYVRSQIVERINAWNFDGEAILTAGDGVGVGKVFHYSIGKIGVHQRVYILSGFKCDGKYLYNYFSSRFYNRVKRLSAKNSVDSVRMEMITEMPLSLPSLEEQNKIGRLLSLLEDRIATQNKIIEDLKKLKSAIIDRVLFNIGNHEMLGDYVKVQGGYAFKSSEFKEYGVPVIRISNLPQDSIYVDLKDCVYYDSGDYSNYVISNDMLLIAMSGATTGKTAIYSNQFIAYLNQRVGCFRNIKHIYYPYLYVLVESKLFKNQLSSKLIAGAQPNISSSDLESILLPFPCIELQQEIADSIKSVNKKINCEEKLMSLYTENKTYLLQQMFI